MHSYLKTADIHWWYNRRLTGVLYWFMAAFAVLFLRLLYLQVFAGDEFRRLSDNNCIRLQSIEPSRGLIFDRNGELLVDNRPSFDLGIVLKDAGPIGPTVEKLSRYLEVNEKELLSKIEQSKVSSYKPVLLKHDIGRDVLALIEAHKFDLPGVVINVKPLRHYIYRQSAAHLIGYLSEINSSELQSGRYTGYRGGDYIGKFGVEKAFERYLRGKRGGRQVEVNAAGQVIRVLKAVNAQPGNNVFLAIDHTLQLKAEDLLEGKAGVVAAMDTATGHILALASSPSYDQNLFVSGMSHKQWNALVENPFRPLENKAVQGEYPPASVYKIITAIAGLEEGIIDENTTFFCPGQFKYGDWIYRCWKRDGHGEVNLVKALAQSCDVFFYNIGKELGIKRLALYAKACGLGMPTGINLDEEGYGLVPTPAWKKQRTGISWHGGETISMAIGQGYNLATPIQMLVLISAVANGGTRYKPLIVNRIETSEGKIVYESKAQIMGKLPAGKQTMEVIKKGLWDVVNHERGTGWIAHLEEIDISGKTGTAQLVSRKRKTMQYDSDDKPDGTKSLKPHAWFVAYAPSVEPKIAIVVIIEHGEHGSSGAALVAKELIKTYLLDSVHP